MKPSQQQSTWFSWNRRVQNELSCLRRRAGVVKKFSETAPFSERRLKETITGFVMVPLREFFAMLNYCANPYEVGQIN